jgi:hypothetical protein
MPACEQLMQRVEQEPSALFEAQGPAVALSPQCLVVPPAVLGSGFYNRHSGDRYVRRIVSERGANGDIHGRGARFAEASPTNRRSP